MIFVPLNNFGTKWQRPNKSKIGSVFLEHTLTPMYEAAALPIILLKTLSSIVNDGTVMLFEFNVLSCHT